MKIKPTLVSLFSAALFMVASGANAEVVASGAWVRATVPKQQATGAFMRVVSSKETTLQSVKSDSAGLIEVHEMTMDNGVMRMRPVDSLRLYANQPLELKSGGYHLMMMDLKKTLTVGTKVKITLIFKSANGEIETTVVQAPATLAKPQ